VDEKSFVSMSKQDARMHLGLNSEGFYFLLSAASLSDKRKGVDWAIQLILKVKDLNPTTYLGFGRLLCL
jgi:hypothetical protein